MQHYMSVSLIKMCKHGRKIFINKDVFICSHLVKLISIFGKCHCVNSQCSNVIAGISSFVPVNKVSQLSGFFLLHCIFGTTQRHKTIEILRYLLSPCYEQSYIPSTNGSIRISLSLVQSFLSSHMNKTVPLHK